MLDRFSQNLNQLILVLSRKEAARVNAAFVEPEHILLALIRNKTGTAYTILEQLHINFLTLQIVLEQKTSVREGPLLTGKIPLSKVSEHVLERAKQEADAQHSTRTGTEHLLISLTQEPGSILADFFSKEGISPEALTRAFSDAVKQKNTEQRQHRQEKSGVLAEFSRDLTQMSRDGLIDPVVGRSRELKRVMQILSRRTKNNPVLIGEPGVGKTAIIEGLASAIVQDAVPGTLYGKRIIALDITAVLAGTKYRGQFEERIKRIIKEVIEAQDIILFIDELHTLIGTGGSQNTLDAANMLKPALARGEIQCIGATTYEEYRTHLEKDAALERRFQAVSIGEPTKEETCSILKGIRKKYEAYHKVVYSDHIIETIVELASRYIPERFFPDKAIDVMDEAGALKAMEYTQQPHAIFTIEQKIKQLTEQKVQAVAEQDFEQAGLVRDAIRDLQQELSEVKTRWLNREGSAMQAINAADIAATVSLMTDIPVKTIGTDESRRLASLEDELHKTVVGQQEAITVIANAIRRSRAGIASPDRPIGSFLFLGHTGVGKTLLAKGLALFMFGTPEALIRIDMSDYMEKHSAARLVGAPPGYVGFESGGYLTEKVRRKPYAVILLDEIEKAHPDVFNLLLQVLEEGELCDNLGHTVNFRNTIIIMTGNIGSKTLMDEPLGFAPSTAASFDYRLMKKTAELELKKVFSPEFLNRIDSTVYFTPLSQQEIDEIFMIEFKKLEQRLATQHRTLSITGNARRYCVEKSYDPHYGARPMRKLFQTEIEDAIAQHIIGGAFPERAEAVIDVEDSALRLIIKTPCLDFIPTHYTAETVR